MEAEIEKKKQRERAILFIDGSNFYHGMKKLRLSPKDLDYTKFSRKIILEREWVETRYYVGKVRKTGDLTKYKEQRKFLSGLEKFPQVSCHLGRIENQPAERTAKKLTRWLNALERRTDLDLPAQAISELYQITEVASVRYTEKAVDVMIAADMVSMAHQDKYDVAYLLSADGDFTPAVKEVRKAGRKVFVAFCSSLSGWEISQAADTFISIKQDFFGGCW